VGDRVSGTVLLGVLYIFDGRGGRELAFVNGNDLPPQLWVGGWRHRVYFDVE
jgi:hypothetical protein